MNAEEFVFQSFGKPSKVSNTVPRPDAAKSSTASSVYLSRRALQVAPERAHRNEPEHTDHFQSIRRRFSERSDNCCAAMMSVGPCLGRVKTQKSET